MDRKAIAEDVVGLWDMIGDAWLKAHDGIPKTEVHISLFERAHTYIIHKNISEERSGVPSKQKKKPFSKRGGSGRSVTQKQRDFIEDLGGDPDQVSTSQEASDYIEELKEG